MRLLINTATLILLLVVLFCPKARAEIWECVNEAGKKTITNTAHRQINDICRVLDQEKVAYNRLSSELFTGFFLEAEERKLRILELLSESENRNTQASVKRRERKDISDRSPLK